jgi:two-component SAPR family response regulator
MAYKYSYRRVLADQALLISILTQYSQVYYLEMIVILLILASFNMIKKRYSKVLIIDDSKMDNMLIRMILNHIEFSDEIISYENPVEAIKFLRDSGPNDYPQVIFLDINMPIINGFELLDRVQQFNHPAFKECKIYMLSSSDEVEDIKRSRLYPNIVKYLQKPLDKDEII